MSEVAPIAKRLLDDGHGARSSCVLGGRALEDLLDLQDQQSARIVGEIAPKLQQVEVRRVRHKPTESLVVYDCLLRGMASFHRFPHRETTDQALSRFQRANELDPDSATPYRMVAHAVRRKQTRRWADEANDTADAVRVARAAVEFGNDDVILLSAGGRTLTYVGLELDDGFTDHALELGPDLAATWIYSG